MMDASVLALRAPDLMLPVIGFRQWRVEAAALWSPFVEHRWRRGVNAASCFATEGDHDEPAPGHDCTCGLHAWYRPCPRMSSVPAELVAGAIALWGEVELHPSGLRGQYAMVVALALPLMSGTGKRRDVRAIAEALEVPAVPARKLAATALEYGEPVARALRPSWPRRRRLRGA